MAILVYFGPGVVLPASAGMIPAFITNLPQIIRAPRIRGDDPRMKPLARR